MRKELVLGVLFFSGLWGLCEAVLGGALYAAAVPHASVVLTVCGLVILSLAAVYFPHKGIPTAIAGCAMLYKFLNEKTKNHHLTEDLLQDTFIIAYRKLERNNPEYAFATWVFTIANRLAISNYRKQKPQVEEFDFATDETPLCKLMESESHKAIWGQAKRLLPNNHFIALQLFYAEGMKVDQIAEVMDQGVSSVKVWLHRARKRLAAHLKPA